MGCLCSKHQDYEINSEVKQKQQKILLQDYDKCQNELKMLDQEINQQNLEAIELTNENYSKILISQNLKVMNMIGSEEKQWKQNHFYHKEFLKNNSNVKKTQRINKELIQLKRNLPVQITNSIFVCYEQTRTDIMKSIIVGSQDTPYANEPPLVNLMTTGGNQIRFNPNLYTNGYVCLSLLGTWRGEAIETWSPSTTNLHQVLMAIQSMVMTNDVYFNEPYHETEKATERGRAINEGYCNIVRFGTVKFAMTQMILYPPKQFEDIVKVHFFLKKDEIINQIEKWIQEAKSQSQQQMPPLYIGLVNSHNEQYSNMFKQKNGYLNALKSEFIRFKDVVSKISKSEIIKIVSKWNQQLQ